MLVGFTFFVAVICFFERAKPYIHKYTLCFFIKQFINTIIQFALFQYPYYFLPEFFFIPEKHQFLLPLVFSVARHV